MPALLNSAPMIAVNAQTRHVMQWYPPANSMKSKVVKAVMPTAVKLPH